MMYAQCPECLTVYAVDADVLGRGHGLARMLTLGVEERARELGYHVLNLDVRETQEAAIRLYESLGYVRWGINPDYAQVRGKIIRGFYYSKRLRARRGQSQD